MSSRSFYTVMYGPLPWTTAIAVAGGHFHTTVLACVCLGGYHLAAKLSLGIPEKNLDLVLHVVKFACSSEAHANFTTRKFDRTQTI